MPKAVEAILDLLYLGVGIKCVGLRISFHPTDMVGCACGPAFEPGCSKERFLTSKNYK